MAKKKGKGDIPPTESIYGNTGRRSGGKGKLDTTDLPEQVLHGLCWSFRGGEYTDRAAFDKEVKQHQIDILERDTWFPDEVVIPCHQIRVVYTYWQGEEHLDGVVELTSDGVEGFSAGELLFKLHNAVVGPLRENDHCFFEGLSLYFHQTPVKAPLYILHQGS
jgi:hypothetical protein